MAMANLDSQGPHTPRPDVVAYNSVLNACARQSCTQEAREGHGGGGTFHGCFFFWGGEVLSSLKLTVSIVRSYNSLKLTAKTPENRPK